MSSVSPLSVQEPPELQSDPAASPDTETQSSLIGSFRLDNGDSALPGAEVVFGRSPTLLSERFDDTTSPTGGEARAGSEASDYLAVLKDGRRNGSNEADLGETESIVVSLGSL